MQLGILPTCGENLDEVRSENWFDPEMSGTEFIADLMVAEGLRICRWSEENRQFAYRVADILAVPHLAV